MINFDELEITAFVDKMGKPVLTGRREFFNKYAGIFKHLSSTDYVRIIGIGLDVKNDEMFTLEKASTGSDTSYYLYKYWAYGSTAEFEGVVGNFTRFACAGLALTAFTLDGVNE